MISCFTYMELYVLSKHRCCRQLPPFLLFSIYAEHKTGCPITILSIISVAAFVSLELADAMTAKNGCLFCLSRYAFLCPDCLCQGDCFRSSPPPKRAFIDMLSRDCQGHLILLLPSYALSTQSASF